MVTAPDNVALLNLIRNVKPDSVLTKSVQVSYLINYVNEAVIKHGSDPEDIMKRTSLANIDSVWLLPTNLLLIKSDN